MRPAGRARVTERTTCLSSRLRLGAGLHLRRVHPARRQHRRDPARAAVRADHDRGRLRSAPSCVNNQPKVLKATLRGPAGPASRASKYTKARYMELMALLYDILQKARKEGLMSIEKDVEEPHELAAVPEVRRRRHRPPRGRVHHRLPAHDGLGQPQRARDREPDGQRDRDPPPRGARPGRRRSRGWPAACRPSASSPPCSAWSTRWARSASRPPCWAA